MSLSQIQKLQARGQTRLEQAYPATITIDSDDYSAASSGLSTTREVEVGGYMVEIDLTLTLSKTIHPTEPTIGKLLTYKTKQYRIEKVSGDQAPAWTLDCQSPQK